MKRLAAILLLAVLLAIPSEMSSCGPFLPTAVFVRSQGPDEERAFLRGQLGILQPSHERRYLAMAYRILNNEPPNEVQQKAVTGLEQLRESTVTERLQEWLAARKQVSGACAGCRNRSVPPRQFMLCVRARM
jgi:hypothetical protein